MDLQGDYCIREIKMSIAMAKKVFNRKISLLTTKLNIGLRKKLVMCYFRNIALYGSETWTLSGTEIFEELRNMMLEENREDKMVKLKIKFLNM